MGNAGGAGVDGAFLVLGGVRKAAPAVYFVLVS